MNRSILTLTFCLLCLCGAAFGGLPKASCTGTVLDANGAPVADAEVMLLHWKADDLTGEIEVKVLAQTSSDAKGAFAVAADIHPQADAIVVARKKGLALHWACFAQPRGAAVTLRLGKSAPLEGVVVDEANAPVAGAVVRCEPHIQGLTDVTYLPSAAPLEWLRATTDKDGRFRLDDLPAKCRVQLEVSAPGKATTKTVDDCYNNWWASCPYAAGDRNVRVVLAAEAVIEGKVIEKGTNKPVAGVKVFSAEPVAISPLPVVTGKDGAFRIAGLSEGTRTVSLVGPKDQLADWMPASKEVVARAGKTQSVELEVSKGGVLEVSVVDSESNKPIAGAEVTPARASSQDVPADAPAIGSAISDASGVARLRLPPGLYEPIDGKKVGEYDQETIEFDQAAEVEEGKVTKAEIALSKRLGHFLGAVLDPNGRAVEGAVIYGPTFGGHCDRTLTGPGGRFELDEGGSGEDLTLLVRDEERNLVAVAVLNDPNARAAVNLEPAKTIRGRIVDEAGKGVPNASVTISGTPDIGGEGANVDMGNSDTVADDEGRYEIRAVPPGKFTLTGHAYGYGQADVEIEVPSDANAPVAAEKLEIPLADQTISGAVVDEKGKPVAGVTIDISGDRQSDRGTLTTDDSGKFTIRKLCKGSVTISASKDGADGSADAEAGASGIKVTIRKDNSGSPMKSGEDF
jgi:protocatechuate 3,4-dioxygenase beta subunit